MDSCGLSCINRAQDVSDAARDRLAYDDVWPYPVFLKLWQAVSDGIVHKDELSDGKLLCCYAPFVGLSGQSERVEDELEPDRE